jgi:cobalamin biosynthesis Mg chelatase CobN
MRRGSGLRPRTGIRRQSRKGYVRTTNTGTGSSKGRNMLAVGGIGIVGILVIVLIVLAIVYFVRRS